MMPGMNPRKMQAMMKQMGIQQVEIPATEVIIRTADKEIIITNPSVQKVNMMGNQNFQVSGNITERLLDSTPDISEEDVKTVMEQSNVSEDEARKAIEDAKGDLAEAIMGLMKE
ncbi:nascent polypeptide-associated complex protein [Candidatus Woesearchaeota archaeon]|jgi:nascent polypeptide-associated complex subunit alpha|nr:nascent polypeptide-associated complex protein [Candidatus Woesearchaeota archaeon]MBT4151250.1 nascent polypeptide-associated complex protein [Candidatus Woesearchaeota archaeon]MBT4247277.1 nascent polypeptide-associated complex protein [Candidatus Woesearchaeota archaeon]MBT4433990.1 nascent polypeptide-associated complex protein [Candidatus Woesearchaeota archaeon]MBT7332387.1 nascent polypeptide-associated complex protein [Candidatus Woesearchaeota archaeon]